MYTYMGTHTQSQLKIWVPTNSFRSRFDYLVTISDDDLGAYAHSAQSQMKIWVFSHSLR